MKKRLRDNGLSIVLLAIFVLLLFGQAWTGRFEFNREQREHGKAPVSFGEYLGTAHFFEATFENWESEFLQMAVYVIFTVFLFQRGSAESKDPDETEEVDEDPWKHRHEKMVPGPVRRGGWRLKLYSHSLSLALFVLFLVSWIGHGLAGFTELNQDNAEHGEAPLSFGQFLISSRLWFESLQNWQSEFLAVASLVILSIWLREKGSPESKPVASPHRRTA
jgi:hypothetical protein